MIALGAWIRDGRIFLQRRPLEAKVLPGLWELPGGKVEPSESPEAACAREFKEELGLEGQVGTPCGAFRHDYPHGTLTLRVFTVSAEGQPRTEAAWGWFTWDEARRLPQPPANGPILDALARSIC